MLDPHLSNFPADFGVLIKVSLPGVLLSLLGVLLGVGPSLLGVLLGVTCLILFDSDRFPCPFDEVSKALRCHRGRGAKHGIIENNFVVIDLKILSNTFIGECSICSCGTSYFIFELKLIRRHFEF